MNKRLARLEGERIALLKETNAILDATTGREATAAQTATLEANKKKLDAITADIAEELRIEAPSIVTGADIDPNGWPGQLDSSAGFGYADRRPTIKGRVGARYADLFPNGGGVRMQSAEFFAALHSGTFHPGLCALSEGSGASGGYIAPVQVAKDFMGVAYESSLIWPRATVFAMESETLRIPGFDVSSADGKTLFGGMTFGWLNEAGTGVPANPKFVKRELHARKLAIFATASNELVEDGISLEVQLSNAMQQGAGWALDYSFFQGTGAGEPRGILNDAALIEVAKEDGQDADTIVYENCTKMLARLHPACFAKSCWFANPTLIPQLLSMVSPAGLGGTPVPTLREADGGWSLLTRPIYFTEKLPTLGDKGDIVLCDASQYAVGLRRELTIERSAHVRFMTDESVWRGVMRVDGQGLWTGPYTPANGASQSWCVTLAERA